MKAGCTGKNKKEVEVVMVVGGMGLGVAKVHSHSRLAHAQTLSVRHNTRIQFPCGDEKGGGGGGGRAGRGFWTSQCTFSAHR